MKTKPILRAAVLSALLVFSVAWAFAGMRVQNLACELAVNPLGVDVASPRLHWQVASEERGARQTAWQVRVASTLEKLAAGKSDVCDSGRNATDDTTVQFGGRKLNSSEQVFWQVRAWDQRGEPTAWSEPATWTMGLLTADAWLSPETPREVGGMTSVVQSTPGAHWITAATPEENLLLRREFTVKPGLRRALVHVTGLGQYEVFFNGTKAGRDVLAPGWTDYARTVLYDTRDVTALMRQGANAVGLSLGNGMMRVVRPPGRFAKFVADGGPQRAILQLRLEYADGLVEIIGTDEQWRTHAGPITFSSIYGGEDFDARLVPAGWKQPGFDARDWQPAVMYRGPSGVLRGQSFAAERVAPIETRLPVSVRQLGEGVVLYDFGQNASFMPRLKISGPAGSRVKLTGGEIVNDDGTINRSTMGGAHRGSAWWSYTKATDGEETWFPQFYYVGSRYVYAELIPSAVGQPSKDTGENLGTVGARFSPEAAEEDQRTADKTQPPQHSPVQAAEHGLALPKIDALEMVIVHSTAKPVGEFAASDPTLNRIRDLVRWAQRSNLMSILTDCPHREKLGWLEQDHLDGPALRYEWDLARLGARTVRNMAEAQTPDGLIPNIAPEYTVFKGAYRNAAEWGASFIVVPWQQYLFTGDATLLRENYAAMQRYFAFLEGRTVDGVLNDGLGDWYDQVPEKPGRANLTPPALTATAHFYLDALTLGKIAAVLGHVEDAQTFAAKAAGIREHFNRAFFHPGKPEIYGTGSQTSLALPLALGLVEDGNRELVRSALRKDISTRGYTTSGAIGYRYLLRALTDAGESELIYRLITNPEIPGYAYQLKQGNTTLAESWTAQHGASQNHFFLGQIVEWFYRDLAGIAPDPAAPGFKHTLIRPHPVKGLDCVEASHESPYGAIRVRWEQHGGVFKLSATIPANATATVYLPAQVGRVRIPDTKGVEFVGQDGDRAVYRIESGIYDFESTP